MKQGTWHRERFRPESYELGARSSERTHYIEHGRYFFIRRLQNCAGVAPVLLSPQEFAPMFEEVAHSNLVLCLSLPRLLGRLASAISLFRVLVFQSGLSFHRAIHLKPY